MKLPRLNPREARKQSRHNNRKETYTGGRAVSCRQPFLYYMNKGEMYRYLVKRLCCFLFFTSVIFIPAELNDHEFPTYRVVLDPGHGGMSLSPVSRHGDRFDRISGRFLDRYRDGAYTARFAEHRFMYDIATKAADILSDCSSRGSYHAFYRILQKYTDQEVRRVTIETVLSRPDSLKWKDRKKHDPNRPYRLYDYYTDDGECIEGRFSKMNALKPHLVVSLHCARSGPRDYRGMSGVLAAPYSLLHKGLLYLREEIGESDFFYNEYGKYWFSESVKRTPFEWFLNDVSIYFLSMPLDNENELHEEHFRGYRYNMISWAYRDEKHWMIPAGHSIKGSPYADEVHDFVPHGKYWDRERSVYEAYKRDQGPEGFGGDNAYATNEIIRFILYSLKNNKTRLMYTKPGKPYISVWSLPMSVNAINAFLELGYLNRRYDRTLLLHKQDEIAEGIAVGIYSLFAGVSVRDKDSECSPVGKRIDLEKYTVTNKKTYFDMTCE